MAVGAGTELQRCLLLCAEWEALTREGGHIVIVPFIQRKEVRATGSAILVRVSELYFSTWELLENNSESG